jgi:hypothetical protein
MAIQGCHSEQRQESDRETLRCTQGVHERCCTSPAHAYDLTELLGGACVVGKCANTVGRGPCCFRGLATKSDHKTFVHFTTETYRHVMLSVAKYLTLRPFAALRVTSLVCQCRMF